MSNTDSIEIVDIPKELSRQKENRIQKNHINACLFNLVAYAEESNRVQQLSSLIDLCVEKFPSRIFLIEKTQTQGRDYFHVDVLEKCFSKEDVPLVCDQIRIISSESQLPRVLFLLWANFVPDLPIYLLWAQDPLADKVIFPNLQSIATRLIFDIGGSVSLQQFSKNILSIKNSLSIELMDVQWALLSSWRNAFAHVFDTEASIKSLRHTENIHIYYTSTEEHSFYDHEVLALYLIGWLSAKLHWSPSEQYSHEKQRGLLFVNEGKEINVNLHSQVNKTLPPGTITEIEILCEGQQTFSFVYNATLNRVLIHIASEEKCELPISLPLAVQRRGFTFLKELMYANLNRDYFDMLRIPQKSVPE